MDYSPTNNAEEIPWPLIVASFQGGLDAEGAVQLEQWLSLSPANRERYARYEQLWREGLTEYDLYLLADAPAGWTSLQERLSREALSTGREAPSEGKVASSEGKVVHGSFQRKITRWLSVAAILLLLAGAGWWYFTRSAPGTVYQTAVNEQKTITLPDGTSLSLQPQTAISVADDYNKTSRRVTLVRGEALFDVRHQAELPFIVNVGSASVKDIGTSFTIRKKEDSIHVTVHTGKVAFVKNSTGEQHELSGGMAMSFHSREESFGATITQGQPVGAGGYDSTFQDIPLGDIIAIMQKKYGKEIRLADSSMLQKKLTIRLAGESFDDAIRVICATLSLEYSESDGVYVLKK